MGAPHSVRLRLAIGRAVRIWPMLAASGQVRLGMAAGHRRAGVPGRQSAAALAPGQLPATLTQTSLRRGLLLVVRSESGYGRLATVRLRLQPVDARSMPSARALLTFSSSSLALRLDALPHGVKNLDRKLSDMSARFTGFSLRNPPTNARMNAWPTSIGLSNTKFCSVPLWSD